MVRGIKSTVNAVIVVAGEPDAWLPRCREALEIQGFKKVQVNPEARQITADLKQIIGTMWGTVGITLSSESPGSTRIDMAATARTDNVYRLNKHPGHRMIERFQKGLSTLGSMASLGAPAPLPDDPLNRVKKLHDLREAGALTDEEVRAREGEGAQRRVAPRVGSTLLTLHARSTQDDGATLKPATEWNMNMELTVVMDGTERLSVQVDPPDRKAERRVLDEAYSLLEMYPDAEVVIWVGWHPDDPEWFKR